MLLPANFALRVTTNDMNFAELQYNYICTYSQSKRYATITVSASSLSSPLWGHALTTYKP